MTKKYKSYQQMDQSSMKKIKGGGADVSVSTRWRCLRANSWVFQICHIGNPIFDDCAADAVKCLNTGEVCTVNACA